MPRSRQRHERVFQRPRAGRQAQHGDPLVAGDRADLLGARAQHVQHVAVALDPVAEALERAGQPDRILRADFGRGTVVAAEHRIQRAVGAKLAAGDDDDVVDRLGDLGEDVAGDEHGATARPPARARDHAARRCPGVEAVGRLVEDQDARIAEQCAGDRQALAHAHRVALHRPVGCIGEADRRQDLVDPAGRMLGR